MDRFTGSSYITNGSYQRGPQKTNLRMKQLQRQITQYREAINNKDSEIEYLNQKNKQLMQSQNKLSTNTNKQSDGIYESSLLEQVQRLNLKLQDKSKQYERLYEKYISLENDMAAMQDFTADLDRQRKFLADKLANLQIHTEGDEVVGQLENKLVLMSTEILRLGQLSRNKGQQNNDLRFKIKVQEEEIEHLEKQMSEKQKTLIQYRQKLRSLQKRHLQVQSSRQYENESTYKTLSLQIERLNILLNNKFEEIRSLQQRNKTLEEKVKMSNNNAGSRNIGELQIEIQRLTKSNGSLKQQISEIEGQLKKVKRQNKQFNEQNERWKRANRKLEDELEQTKRNYIKNQNEKIKIQVETSERTIREQKSVIQQLQSQANIQAQQRENQLKLRFKQDLSNLQLLLQKSEGKCNSLITDLMKYEQKLVMLSQQVQRLNLQNNRYIQENAELKRLQYKIQSKEREVKQIERIKQSAYIQMKRDKSQIQRLKGENRELWQKVKELQGKQYRLNSLQDEVQIVTQRLQSKQRQYRLLQQKFNDTVNNKNYEYRIRELEGQLQTERKSFRQRQEQSAYFHQRQISNLREAMGKLDIKIKQLSSQNSSKQSNFILLAEEIRRLNEVLSDTSQTILQQKREINLLEHNLRTAESSIQKMKNSANSNERLEEEIRKRVEVYQKQIALYQQDNITLKNKTQQLMNVCQTQKQDIHNSKLNLQDVKQALKNKELEVKDLIQSITLNKKNEENLLQLIKQIKQSNYRLERKLGQIQQQYIRKLEDKSIEKQQLQKQYVEYHKKIRQAQIQKNNIKFEAASLQSKYEMILKRERQLQTENQRLRNRLDEQSISKANLLKSIKQEDKSKEYEHDQQIKKALKRITQLQLQLNSKGNQIYKCQLRIKQLQDQNYRIQASYQDYEGERKREIQNRLQEAKYNLSKKQEELLNYRTQITRLQEELGKKNEALEIKKLKITEYENKLALISQQLERTNSIIFSKNGQIQSLSAKLMKFQEDSSKQGKEIIEPLTIQITRLNTVICQSLENCKQLQQQILNKNRQIRRIGDFNKKSQEQFKDKIFHLEQQFEKILQENHKYSAAFTVLNRKIQDLQIMQADYDNIKTKLIELNGEKNKYKNTIAELQTQISFLKNTYQNNLQQQKHSLTSMATLKSSELQQIKRQMERRITLLVSQNEQTMSQLQSVRRQLENSDHQCTAAKKQLIRVKNDLVNMDRQKEKYRIMNQQIMDKVQKMAFSKTSEGSSKEFYEMQIKHLESVIRQYESQHSTMKQQFQRTIREKERSRENSSVGSNHRMSSNNNSLQKSNSNDLQQKYTILESLHLKLKKEADGLREKVTEYDYKMKKLKGEFELINKLTHEYKDENQYLRLNNHSECIYVGKSVNNRNFSLGSSQTQKFEKNQEILIKQTLASQIDRLGVLNGNLRREVEDLRLQGVDYQSLKNRYDQLTCMYVLVAAEVQSLRQRKGG